MGRITAKPLEEPFSSIVNSADQVVLFSFGSVVNSSEMSWAWKTALMGAFEAMPNVTFIFRYEGDDLAAAKPKNVVIAKWLPQRDLLRKFHAADVRIPADIQELAERERSALCLK